MADELPARDVRLPGEGQATGSTPAARRLWAIAPAELLTRLVRQLPSAEKLCLRYHLAAQTRVLVGPDNDLWESVGGGTPWALAGSRLAGQRDVWLLASIEDLGAAAVRAFREWNREARAAGYKSIIEVMDQLDEGAAIAAMEEGMKP